jgi:hypothetical protein
MSLPKQKATRHVLYAYICKPTATQVCAFLCGLAQSGITISHLGKSDPPRKFGGTINDAVDLIFSGSDLTNYTFARDSARKLDFDVQIHHDPRWTHSTVSASCPDPAQLGLVADIAKAAFALFIAIRGVSGGDKQQPWDVLCVTEECPKDLRTKFAAI